jgi:hypothetical protein
MRIEFLLPLAAVVAASGCGSERTKQPAPSVPERDLTLQTALSAQVEIASPVELQRIPAEPQASHAVRRTRRHAPVFQPTVVPATLRTTTATTPVPTVQPAVEPVTVASEPANPHELLPGKTITMIPASSGPSTAPDPSDDAPEIRTRMGGTVGGGHGGGTCRGRGRGIGGGSAPPAVLR